MQVYRALVLTLVSATQQVALRDAFNNIQHTMQVYGAFINVSASSKHLLHKTDTKVFHHISVK